MIGRETLSHRPIICCLNFDQPPLPTFCIPPFTCQLLRCARLGMLCRLAFVNTSPFLKAALLDLEKSTQKNAMKCACCSKLQIAAPKQSTASSAFSLNHQETLPSCTSGRASIRRPTCCTTMPPSILKIDTSIGPPSCGHDLQTSKLSVACEFDAKDRF